MRIVISAGGTGGHIYPALAIINKIKEKEPNSEVLYIGTHNRMEKDIVPKCGIPFKSIEVYGISKNILKTIKALNCFRKATKECEKIISDFKPDVVIGVGGYVTAPVLRAASKLGIKTFIHEQNSIPGKANRYLARKVDLIGTSFRSSIEYFPNNKVIFTGNPCSESAKSAVPMSKSEYNLSKDKKLVLFVMGSLGSSKMNEILIRTMPKFEGKDYEVLFVTGKDGYESVKDIKFPSNVVVVPYIENMAKMLKNTDLIVSRAGASTISEIIALQIPSILIPSPYVPNNHQYKNALDMIQNDACVVIKEEAVSSSLLVSEVDNLINDEERINRFKTNLSKLGIDDSATLIYESLVKLIDRK